MVITLIYLKADYYNNGFKQGRAKRWASKLNNTFVIFRKTGQEIQEAIVDAFDEAKGNTERALKEAKREVPRYREAINNHQEKTLELLKK